MTGEFGRGCGEDVVELGEDAAAGGRGGHAVLGHHHADRRTESERFTAVAACDGAGAPLTVSPDHLERIQQTQYGDDGANQPKGCSVTASESPIGPAADTGGEVWTEYGFRRSEHGYE
ncbi:hypothetical protein ACH4NF_35505 [Streptomyces sp. NPDC017248]|uniref:hypothetical protein n=1 Tax=unclassified Streptomyces TaxID=2593676 RepID=UPI0037A7FB3E